jgi:hypothetical protein
LLVISALCARASSCVRRRSASVAGSVARVRRRSRIVSKRWGRLKDRVASISRCRVRLVVQSAREERASTRYERNFARLLARFLAEDPSLGCAPICKCLTFARKPSVIIEIALHGGGAVNQSGIVDDVCETTSMTARRTALSYGAPTDSAVLGGFPSLRRDMRSECKHRADWHAAASVLLDKVVRHAPAHRAASGSRRAKQQHNRPERPSRVLR